MDILDKIISNKKKEVSLLKKSFPIEDLESGIKNKSYLKRDFLGSFLDRNIISIIAEIKKASPSKGVILEDFQPLKIALEYEAGGASAISGAARGRAILASGPGSRPGMPRGWFTPPPSQAFVM